MSNDFFKNIVDQLKDEDLSIAADGTNAAEFTGFIDTGSYTLNAVLSGSIWGGMPNNKFLGFAGETTTGKTFFTLGICKYFLDSNPSAGVVYYDSESSVNRTLLTERGIDPRRVVIGEPITVQDFKHKALSFIDAYQKVDKKDRPPLLLVLDSLGQLSTSKEMEDTREGKEVKDMTRPQIVKAAFRTLRLPCAKLQIPMIVTNHTYAGIGGMYPTQEISGGAGFKYSADSIAMLSKRKEKVDDEVIGNVVHVRMWKSRMSRENKVVDVLLTYDKGLDRYYGLLPLAEKYGVLKKVSTRFEFPDGSKHFPSAINKNGARFYTKEILDRIEEGVRNEFQYGKPVDTSAEEVMEMVDEA